MPFFKTAQRLVYYAHVPKCGGTSIADYISLRFGPLAFHDNIYMSRPEAQRWTRSSPQHVDAATLERLVPLPFFDAVFAVVRHPVARAISTYHFQLEVERTIPAGTGFSEWLARLAPDVPFLYDNHVRPMDMIVPPGATIFHLEHGIDALVDWFDLVAGTRSGPRVILPENARGAYLKGNTTPRVKPAAADIDLIGRIYARDFARFGYLPDNPQPKAAAPVLSAAFLAERDAALAAANRPWARLRRRIRRRLARL
jgi:hypothetical protein